MELIIPPEILRIVVTQDMSIRQARAVLVNYVYYKKGVYAPEFMTAEITNIPNFEKNVTIACNYFN